LRLLGSTTAIFIYLLLRLIEEVISLAPDNNWLRKCCIYLLVNDLDKNME